jgi:hypothetical protein
MLVRAQHTRSTPGEKPGFVAITCAFAAQNAFGSPVS